MAADNSQETSLKHVAAIHNSQVLHYDNISEMSGAAYTLKLFFPSLFSFLFFFDKMLFNVQNKF